MSDSQRQRLWLVAAGLLTALKLWFTRGQGVYAIGSAGLDDRLFVELAQHLVRGEWLGPYDVLTLAKGPAYPLFIAATFLVGLPLFAAQHLFYAAACLAFVAALCPAVRSAGLRFAAFALLMVNPMTFDAPGMGRVLRQQIYGPLALMIIAGLVALYLRRDRNWRRNLPWALLLGAAAGAFYLTREEAVWLLPTVLVLVVACIVGARRSSQLCARHTVALLGLATGVATVPVFAVSALNQHYYGWFGTCEFRAAAFRDAYGAMIRVEVGPELPYIPVSREARVAMAEISPAFAEVQRAFDSSLAQAWAGHGEFFTGLPADAEQIGGGWFMWALREAVAQAGHSSDAVTALAFYQRLADEINTACADGRLPAGPERSGFAPRWREGDSARLVGALGELTDFVVRFRHFGATPPPSTGSPEELQLFRDLTRERLQPPAGELDVVGAKRFILNMWKVGVLQSAGQLLRFAMLGLLVTAAVGGALSAGYALVRRRWTFPLTLAIAAAGACAASLVIHAVVQATSFPVKTVTSFAPIYPLLLVFVIAMAWHLASVIPNFVRKRGKSTSAAAPLVLEPEHAPETRRVLWSWAAAATLAALLPFLIWQGSFAQLFWFGDGFLLLDQLAQMDFGAWTTRVFAENFVPLFKLLWGGAALGFGGSYLAMLWLLWLTHAFNAVLFARWLRAAGFPSYAAELAVGVFALTPANLETLGWSVQWSAVLATLFLLLALWWLESNRTLAVRWSWRLVVPLFLFAAASASSFSRGVLTGGIVAAGILLPALVARSWPSLQARWTAALACLIPGVAVALVIMSASTGNHQHIEGHGLAMAQFAAAYFLLNPLYSWVAEGPIAAGWLPVFAVIKLAVIIGGLWISRGRIRHALWLLLIYDLGNAALIGVGRYHTGFLAALSPRYQYSSLLAFLPFGALLVQQGWERVRSPVHRIWAMRATAGLLASWCLLGWPAELRTFTARRGHELRALMAAPATNDPSVRVPALEYMHIERAKALQRAFNLH